MKKILVAIAATAAVAAPIALAAPADATMGDSNPKVCTAREYRAVHKGQTKAQVARILDGTGRQTMAYTMFGDRYETRQYGPIRWNTTMCTVDYKNGIVTSKFRI